MDMEKILRALEEILFEKQDEIRRLEAENEQLRIQCRNAEQWRKECVGKKECEVLRLEAQVKELQAKITELDIAKSQLEIDVDTYNNLVDRMVEQKRALQERIAALEKQCSNNSSDALQTSFQLAAANELLERERKEKEALNAELKKLQAYNEWVERQWKNAERNSSDCLERQREQLEKQYIKDTQTFRELVRKQNAKLLRLEAENECLKKRVAELEKQCSDYGSDALQTSFQLDAANKLIEMERTEREYREKQVAELQGRIADLQRISDDEFP